MPRPPFPNRRDFLKAGLLTGGVAAAVAARPGMTAAQTQPPPPTGHPGHGEGSGPVGEVDLSLFNPTEFLETFDAGTVSREAGRTVREWKIIAQNKDIEVAPGVWFPAWTYNGQVPGPTFRATAGDWLRFHFLNASPHPHTIHFHGFHPPSMDGLEAVEPGGTFTYEFEAQPFGLHLYHCHVMPLKRHIHKGLYGAFIIDPPQGRPPAREMVMVMNAFDTNFDGENEVYAVNTVGFHYLNHPIPVRVGAPQRVYLVNLTEFDPINSFHLHASMYRLYRTGTQLDTFEFTDTVTMCQGERHILEFTLDHPGLYMFHAHQSEFAELGWIGFFEAKVS
jgi:FtsP/CotA-like multicopper oxidase with cupredoxin domain